MRATSSIDTGAGVDVGAPQLGNQKMPAAEDIQRQIAVAIIVAMEEAPFLVPMHRVVGSIEVEHDLLARRLVRLDEQVNEQVFDRCRVHGEKGRGKADVVVRSSSRQKLTGPL